MPRIHLDPPLVPKKGGVLKALSIARFSTKNQDPRSNADQQALVRRWVGDRYEGQIEWTDIAGQGSGEWIDRSQVRDAQAQVESGRYDLVIMEDAARYMRRAQAVTFCELCEDCGTRLVAINDNIDTARDWRLHAFFAAIKHELSNTDTSARISRTKRSRFLLGDGVQTLPYGYLKSGSNERDVQKDPTAEPIYDEWFRRLERGATFSEIADWLNAKEVATGPWCRSKKWTSKMVGRVTRNPILKGLRVRGLLTTKRINKTGRYVSVKAAPSERQERRCAHLAFIDPDRYDRVIALLNERTGKYRAGRGPDGDPRLGRPKKKTIWPGQSIHCGICGGLFRYGGHGQNDHLLCRGAYEYRCWNGATVDGTLARSKLGDAILGQIEALPEFDSGFIAGLREEIAKLDERRKDQLTDAKNKRTQIQKRLANLVEFISEGKASSAIGDELRRLEMENEHIVCWIKELEQQPEQLIELPPIEDVRRHAREVFATQANEPSEFGRFMRRLIPEIKVFPYRLCDDGPVVLRAHFTLTLVPLVPGPWSAAMQIHMKIPMIVDLFSAPQRETFRKQVMAGLASGQNLKQAAATLNITATAAQRAAALQRKILELGLDDPYVRLTEPPKDCGKFRRHKHSRYKFEPFDGA